MALSVFAAAALTALALQSPVTAAEVSMLRLVDAPSMNIPKALAASPKVAPVRLNLAALDESRLTLPLPDGMLLRVQRTDVERRGRRDYAWRGKTFDAKGQVDGWVTITVYKNLMRGRIVTPGKIWDLVNEGGRYWLAQHVDADLPCGTTERSKVPLDLKQALAQKAESEAPDGLKAAPAGAEAGFTRLRLAVVYNRATTLGDTNRLLLAIRAAVDDANTALANDSINARIELVGTREVSHAESQDPVEDLEYLYDDPSMVAFRRQVNAPLLSMIVIRSPGICGIGNLMSPEEYQGRSPALGVNLVVRACLDSQTLMHELGHNLGAHHDPANTSPGEALFPYGYGHVVVGSFRTIMAYGTECGAGECPRIDHFSNPRVTFAGSPVGIANERDNARLIEQTHFRYAVKAAPGAVCKAGADRLCLLKKRFQVEVLWNNQFNGTSGNGRAVPRTDAAGFFSFGDPSNLELMVKLLDFGDTVKVFWGQLTNLKYQLVITDTKTGESKTYQNTPGDCGGIDQGAFPGGLALDAATLAPVTPLPGREASCRTSGQELCLDNRFSVTVDWRNPGNGTQGQGVAVPFSKVTGAFHFGQASNLELMAKVINSGDRIDFFWGALSDLEYTIHVTDTLTGQVKTYQNAAGRYCGGLEVDAF
jgi:hypothetical protein